MAATDLAAKRYAIAAFELASPGGDLAAWQRALDQLAAFVSRADIGGVLANNRVDQATKQRLLEAGIAGLPPLAMNLARLLVKKGRAALAPQVAEQFRALVEEHEGIARARAITAVPLSDAERESLAQRLRQQTGSQIVLQTDVDPALLGGVVVQIGDRLIDASTRARLEALRRSLVGAV